MKRFLPETVKGEHYRQYMCKLHEICGLIMLKMTRKKKLSLENGEETDLNKYIEKVPENLEGIQETLDEEYMDDPQSKKQENNEDINIDSSNKTKKKSAREQRNDKNIILSGSEQL